MATSIYQQQDHSCFTEAQYFNSSSEGSSPDSQVFYQVRIPSPLHPQQMDQAILNTPPSSCEMIRYESTPPFFHVYPLTDEVPIEGGNSETLNRTNQGTPQSSSSSALESNSNPRMQRRRAQNRSSQRAHRERKEQRIKDLEFQLRDSHVKVQDLLQFSSRQADQVANLNYQISELTQEVNALRFGQDQVSKETSVFDSFDAF